MAPLSFDRVGKVYSDGTRALTDFDLEIGDGEFMVLVGPSGCGKTTALRMVAGLEDVSEGHIRIGDTPVNDLEPGDRDIAMVFQNYALYPHMSVYENMAFGLTNRREPKDEIRRKVEAIAGVLGLREHLRRKPRQLSGGQRQRVAMGRAMIRNPRVLLMDEPLSNLDAKLRVQMRAEIKRIQSSLGVTTMYVTHDQVEAMTMGDRVTVMRHGEVQQTGHPQTLYDAPQNLFVAGFMGSPTMNLFRGRIEEAAGDRLRCRIGEQSLELPQATLASRQRLRAYAGRELAVGIRPEHLRLAASGEPAANRVHGRVVLAESLGSEWLLHVDFEAGSVLADDEPASAEALHPLPQEIQTAAAGSVSPGAEVGRASLVARLHRQPEIRGSERIELSVDTQLLHFFDLDTGVAVADE
jgi:multiple sugar transport system ATP-binding protein